MVSAAVERAEAEWSDATAAAMEGDMAAAEHAEETAVTAMCRRPMPG